MQDVNITSFLYVQKKARLVRAGLCTADRDFASDVHLLLNVAFMDVADTLVGFHLKPGTHGFGNL